MLLGLKTVPWELLSHAVETVPCAFRKSLGFYRFTMNQDPIIRSAFKLREACAYLGGLSPITVRRLIQQGKIRRHPALRHVLITRRELDRFLSE